jgi:hypothetical protein
MQQNEVLPVVTDEDGSSFGGDQQVLVICGACEPDFISGYGRVSGHTEKASDLDRDVMVEIEVCHEGYGRLAARRLSITFLCRR